MINTNKLKGLMAENNISQTKLANMMGISVQTLNAKLLEKREFTISEADKICNVLNIADVETYFFA